MVENDIRVAVRERYTQFAQAGSSCCGGGTCSSEDVGYTKEQMAAIPEEANLGLGCGNPLAGAEVKPGETVLDLGSGAGIDAFLASREVGPLGHVIGVDMTTAMLQRARAAAARGNYTNVDFRLGEIEHLPVARASVDVIISNCVINLSPHKDQVFREAMRVLRPGGRLVVSDLVLLRPLPDAVRNSVEAYVGCIAGASLREEYLELMRAAGFRDVQIVQESRYPAADGVAPQDNPHDEALSYVVSAKVRARKPA